jgi:hypothetical protein
MKNPMDRIFRSKMYSQIPRLKGLHFYLQRKAASSTLLKVLQF